MTMSENLASALSKIKEDSGLSLGELAERLKVSRSSLQGYISGKGVPKLSTISILAQSLKMEPGELLSGMIPQKTADTAEHEIIIQQLMTNYTRQSERLLKNLRTLQDMLTENAGNCFDSQFCGQYDSPVCEDRT